MSERVHFLEANGVRLAVREWGTPGAQAAICVPGSALPSELFCGVEPLLADRFHGYSLDRRGHGRSDKPAEGYDFTHFRDDLISVIDQLGLQNAVGIGHSAGATDMLMAAAARPESFERLLIMEPTIQDPRTPPLTLPDPDPYPERLANTFRKYTAFPSLQAAFDRWRPREPWSRTREALFWRYLEGAFEVVEDSSARLRCMPALEVQMLHRITRAMNHHYVPPEGESDPFAPLLGLERHVTLVRMEASGEIYGKMADIAEAILPRVTRLNIPSAGHLLPLEQPELVAELASG